ncbi:MAG TPA: hypothetical protein VHB98_06990 [Chloroflexota bacterium]|nr:hypothetical protein [Chloroflexota bacterium]
MALPVGIFGNAIVGIGVGLAIVCLMAARTSWQRARMLRTARRLQQPTCCAMDYPVVYHGWHGSIHTLTFLNGVYAEAFAQANASKVVW